MKAETVRRSKLMKILLKNIDSKTLQASGKESSKENENASNAMEVSLENVIFF